MNNLAWVDAYATAELVRSGTASPKELVDAAIERIERINPQLNAVIHERFDKARAEAAGNLPDGPLRGVPMLLKDECPSAGDPYTCGAGFLKGSGYVADHDSYVAAKFRQAGFVIVGRTNMPELGTSITTEPLAYGPAHNPWSLDHSTGGSSGGSAAAVAAGLVPVAHANDGGGSIRIPGANCGLVGLKPTRGRVSEGPDHGESWSGCTIEHAVTRTVRDSAIMLDCIAGWMPGDPYTAPPPARPFATDVGADPGRLRIGLLDHPPLPEVPADPECAAAVQSAGRLLESLGHAVEPAYPAAMEDPGFVEHYSILVAVDLVADVDEFSSLLGRTITDDELEPGNQLVAALGRALTPAQYLASRRWMDRFSRRMASWWANDGFDVLASPVLNGPPPGLGWLTDPAEGYPRLLSMLQYTAQFNVTGQPAVSLPLHWSADRLPIGVQFVAPYGREDLLIRLASQLELNQPWAQHQPPVRA